MRKLKNCIKHLKEETESWYFNNRHLYTGENIKNLLYGVYRYCDYIIVYGAFYDEDLKRPIEHISISHTSYKALDRNNIDKKIRYIIKNFIGDNYEIDSQQTTNLVLNIYEKA